MIESKSRETNRIKKNGLKKSKWNRLYKKSAVLFLVIGLCTFLLQTAKWFQSTWDQIDFATVVYQLSTPLKGTSSEIIIGFCKAVLPHTCIYTFAIVLFYYYFERFFCLLSFEFKIRFFSKEICLKNGRKFYAAGKVCFWTALITILGWGIAGKITELGIDDYIAEIRESSEIFENYYVDPKNVTLTFPEQKRNLIFIYLESMETTYASAEAGGGKAVNYIPELTALAEEYISISNTDKMGGVRQCTLTGWTMAALLGTTSGVPYKIPGDGNSSERYAEFLPGIMTLGDILQKEGYENYFLCGSDAEFAGRDVYFRKHGDYQIQDYFWAQENGYVSEEHAAPWGFEDAWLFEIAKQELTKIAASGKNFNYTMLTVDTHTPAGYICSLCDEKYEHPYANAIACSSRQTYQFVRWIQQQDWYENTTVVLQGDHNSMVADFWDDIGDFKRRTFNCFINLPEDANTQNVKNRDATSVDLFPTTLASLGVTIEGERLGLGTNVFSDSRTLAEDIGWKDFNAELKKYSKYYIDVFVKDKTD